jgi:hypothetical protein
VEGVLAMPRLAKIAGIVGGIVLGAAGATTAGAAASGLDRLPAAQISPSPSPSTKARGYCEDYVAHLARNLGVSKSRANDALKQADRQTVSNAVRSGSLTPKQASAANAQINGGDACTAAYNLARLAHGAERAERGMVLQAAAQAAGINPDELHTALSQGKSVSQVAHAGTTEQQFSSSFQTNLKRELDGQVKAGNLTQTQENKALKKAPRIAQHLWTSGSRHNHNHNHNGSE